MTLKERVEDSPVIYFLGALLAGFLGGLGTYEAILRIARLDTVRQGTYVSQEELARGYVRRTEIKESNRGATEAARLEPTTSSASGAPAVPDQDVAPVSVSPTSPPFPRIVETENYLFELSTCALSSDEVRCDLLVTAKNQGRELMLWGTSRLIENDGNEIFASQIWLGNEYSKGGNYNQIHKGLTRGVPLKMRVEFAGVNPSTSSKNVRLVELVIEGEFKVPFRNVGLI